MLQVLVGEYGESPLETLAAVSAEVLLPLLNNPANRVDWPEALATEVTENLHQFIARGKVCSAERFKHPRNKLTVALYLHCQLAARVIVTDSPQQGH